MNALDRTLSLFGLQRRSYDAATGSVQRYDGQRARFSSYISETSAAQQPVQSKARHAAANNALAAAGISAWVTATVGTGLVPTSQHPAAAVRSTLDAAFARWAKRCTVDGMNWGYACAAMVRAERIDGGAIALWHDDRLRLLPYEQLAHDLTSTLSDGRAIIGGVEIDDLGRVLALHVHPSLPDGILGAYAPPVRVAADEVIHLHEPAGPGALHGVSSLAPVLLALSELAGLEDGLVVGARVASLLSVLLIDKNATTSDDPLPEGQELAPGAILKLAGDLDVKTLAPQQAQQTSELVQHLIRVIASGMDVPAHLLDGNLTQANYSSLRAALVTFRQKVEAYQYNVLEPRLLSRVWERVVTSAVLSGDVAAPIDDDLLAVEWIAPAQPWVDPAKDAEATIKLIDAKLMSRRQAVAALGYSVEKLDAEIAADTAREASLGIAKQEPTDGGA